MTLFLKQTENFELRIYAPSFSKTMSLPFLFVNMSFMYYLNRQIIIKMFMYVTKVSFGVLASRIVIYGTGAIKVLQKE